VIIAFLVLLMYRVYSRRNVAEPPSWMGKLGDARPKFSLRLGFLLFFLMPTDIITMITVAAYLANNDLALWQSLPFIILTVFLVSIPLLILLVAGDRAEVLLPKIRDWMNKNSWIVSEVVIAFFLAITIF